MSSAFENATRFAIEELVKAKASTSRFGYVLTNESLQELVQDILDLLMTSRSLKAGGDRLINAGAFSQAPTPAAGSAATLKERAKMPPASPFQNKQPGQRNLR
ncbi:MAG: hypothetical protein KBD78_06125 [Oligoflexales bacterium]|nr:hypothetical protein [Oligoflexales bacterium]